MYNNNEKNNKNKNTIRPLLLLTKSYYWRPKVLLVVFIVTASAIHYYEFVFRSSATMMVVASCKELEKEGDKVVVVSSSSNAIINNNMNNNIINNNRNHHQQCKTQIPALDVALIEYHIDDDEDDDGSSSSNSKKNHVNSRPGVTGSSIPGAIRMMLLGQQKQQLSSASSITIDEDADTYYGSEQAVAELEQKACGGWNGTTNHYNIRDCIIQSIPFDSDNREPASNHKQNMSHNNHKRQ
jgi:hypothetical protein